jgi:hypothetical protein
MPELGLHAVIRVPSFQLHGFSRMTGDPLLKINQAGEDDSLTRCRATNRSHDTPHEKTGGRFLLEGHSTAVVQKGAPGC